MVAAAAGVPSDMVHIKPTCKYEKKLLIYNINIQFLCD
jgi:hypothetical protein